MAIFGALEEFFSEVIYPNRYVFGLLGVVVLAVVTAAAYRLGWFAWLARHRNASLALGVPALVVLGLGGYYLASPLWERSELIEASPLATPSPAASPPTESPAGTVPTPTVSPAAATPAFTTRVIAEGEWQGADEFHFARGRALLIETAPGVYTVRVEEFSVRNGPDLFVYLSPSPTGYADGALNLGELKATDGAFNYEVPEGTDISQFASVVIWCRAFSVLFGTAALA